MMELPNAAEARTKKNTPPRNRTLNLLIKSQYFHSILAFAQLFYSRIIYYYKI